jgi:glycosyltransferase involved in cell wall biosynthesis
MAAERAIIATRVGGIPRIIRHQETGLLIDVGDVAGLRGAIERLLGNPPEAAHFAKAGRALVEQQFSSAAMARKYLNIFEEVSPLRAAGAKQRMDAPPPAPSPAAEFTAGGLRK